MSAQQSSAEVRALLRAGRIEEAAQRIAPLSDRTNGSDSWRLVAELCFAVAERVCVRKGMPGFRRDVAGDAAFAVIRYLHSRGWSDAEALVKVAERAANKHAEWQRRYWRRSSASIGPMVDQVQEVGFDPDEIARDVARLWQLALAQLDADHPIHASQVRGRIAERRMPVC